MVASPTPPNPTPSVTFWGAARSVSGSMHLVEAAGQEILLDCGLYQGRRGEAERRNSAFPFHPNRIAAVLLSHAHLDHCGNLPGLVRQGFRGPIYCTPLTAELAAVMLADAAKVQEEESAHANIRRQYAEPWVQPLYTTGDAARATGLFRQVPYGQPVEIAPGLRATFVDAGHLPGSAMIAVEAEQEGRRYTVTYTGDLGRPNQGVLPLPAPVPPAGLVLSECTYGGRRHPAPDETKAQLAQAIERTADRGGKVIIPAFGLGRTQIVVHWLLELMRSRRLSRLPVFVDSPLAAAVAAVFRRHPDAFAVDLPGDQDEVTYVKAIDESLALTERPGPCVVVASGGMCEGGRVVSHLSKCVGDANCTIVLVSYQAQRTLGRQLIERPPVVPVVGKFLPLRAEVVHLEGFSGHADHEDLVSHLAPLARRGARVRLVHGEPTAAEALATALAESGLTDVTAPAPGDRDELLPE
jgi:metallo-beta-lactamase family protein